MKLIVGLGNPGQRYAGTRHNVGYDVVAALASARQGTWKSSRFEAEVAEVLLGSCRVMLAAPLTYMNLSGRSVRSLIQFYKLPLDDLLVVSDDLNLPVGRMRLRSSGSAGGQKGLQNIIDQLGTDQFCRLRIGVGRPPQGASATNYVLQRFSKPERTVIDRVIPAAVQAAECWALEGVEVAMSRFNALDFSSGDESEAPPTIER